MCANFSINSNLPGAYVTFTSEPAVTVGSSTIIPVLVLALDSAYMQETQASAACQANTSTSTVILPATAAIAAGEWAGLYVYLGTAQQARQITNNTAAIAGANTTLTVSIPFSVAPTTAETAVIRRWEKLHLPSLHSSITDFAEKFIKRNAAGQFDWSNAGEAAYHTINEFKKNGGTLFYALPVEHDSVSELAPTSDELFVSRMLSISPQPELVVLSKQPSMLVSGEIISSDDYATVDEAWLTYIDGRAEDATIDDEEHQLFLVTDTPTASSSAAVTYKTTTLNEDNERYGLWHGQYVVPGSPDVAGRTSVVNAAPATAGLINRVSLQAPESFGHAVEGRNYTQLSGAGSLVEELTVAGRLSLESNGINPIVSKPGKGTYIESSYTGAKSSSDTGSDPFEFLHVVITRHKIWHLVQPILSSIQAEPNTAIVRAGVLALIGAQMRQLKTQGIIADYRLADSTTSADITSGIARFELSFQGNREIDFISLTLSASFAS
jgi:hypothetical protein